MSKQVDKLNGLTPGVIGLLVVGMAIIVVIAGAVVTITSPASLTFHAYVLDVVVLAGALGIGAGIGTGVTAAVKSSNGNHHDESEG